MELKGLKIKKLKDVETNLEGEAKNQNYLFLENKDRGIKVTVQKEDAQFEGFSPGQVVDVVIKNPQKPVSEFMKKKGKKK